MSLHAQRNREISSRIEVFQCNKLSSQIHIRTYYKCNFFFFIFILYAVVEKDKKQCSNKIYNFYIK